MTVTKFPSTPTPIAAALHAAFVGVAFATGAGGVAQSAHAGAGSGEESTKRRFRIPAGPLGPALSRFAAVAGARLSFDPALTEGKTTRGLMGDFTREEGLAALLAGTGLEWAPGPGGTYTVRPTARAQATPEAPDPTGEQAVELEPIIVTAQSLDQGFKANYQTTATKTPLPIRETPQSVSVITQDSLKDRQVIDLGQALETAAGVTLYSGPGPFAGQDFGLGAIQIRGVDTDFQTDIRQDGFASPIFAAQPDLAPYERIDVVKGPSSLYGRGSAGGFVNRVTKKPLTDFHSEVKGSAGSFDFYRVEGDITGPLFDSDAARGRVVLAYQDTDSFVDSLKSERIVAAPSLEFDLTDSTRLLLQGIYQEDDFIFNPGFPLQQFGGDFRAPDIRRSLFVGVPTDDESNNEILSGSAQLEQELGDDWLATLRLNRSATRHRSQTDNYAYGIQPNGDVGLYSSAFRIDNDVWAGALQLEGKLAILGRPATVVFGVDHTDVQNLNDQFLGILGTANIYDENFADVPMVEPARAFTGVGEQPSTGSYAQIQIRPVDRLSVLLGGRYDSAETTFANRVPGTKNERDDDDFTGRAGLVFDVTSHMSVYALYAQSFQPVLSGVGSNGELLEPEEGEIYEAGLKTEWLDGRLGINTAIFRIERDNVPIPDPDNMPGEFFSISGGLLRSEGIELEINGEPLPGWSLSFGGILLDSEFTKGDPAAIGNSVTGVADWQIGLYTSYEIQAGVLRGLGLGAGLFAIDDRSVSATSSGKLEGYERVDLTAFYKGFDPFDIRLQIRNVFDERYVEGLDRVGGFNQFGSPTAVLLTVRYDFGG